MRKANELVTKLITIAEYTNKHFYNLTPEEKKDLKTIIKELGKMNPFEIMEEQVKKTKEALTKWENWEKKDSTIPEHEAFAEQIGLVTLIASQQEQLIVKVKEETAPLFNGSVF